MAAAWRVRASGLMRRIIIYNIIIIIQIYYNDINAAAAWRVRASGPSARIMASSVLISLMR